MESDAEGAVLKYFSSCDSCWYDYSCFLNPVSFVLHGSQRYSHKYNCCFAVATMASNSVEVARELAKYISVADLRDTEELLECGLREIRVPNCRSNSCMIPALAIAQRICGNRQWERVLKRFMICRSDELLETLTLLGWMGKAGSGDVRSVSDVFGAVERTLPAFDDSLAAHVLKYWNPETVAMVLNKLPKFQLE